MEEEEFSRPSSTGDRERDASAQGFLTVSWKIVAVWLLLITVGAVTTLIVIVAVQDVDLLSTVALALAVLAFAAQLIVSLLQSNAQAQQLSATERVNNETRALLSEISARSAALLSNQLDQFNKVLNYAMRIPEAVENAASVASSGDGEPDDELPERFRELVAENVAQLRQEFLAEQQRSVGALRPADPSSSERARQRRDTNRSWAAKLLTFPDEIAGRKAYATLLTLSPEEKALVQRRALQDYGTAEKGMTPVGHTRKPSDETKSLVSKGVFSLTESKRPPGSWTRRFTDDGYDVARLLLGGDPVPQWLQDLRDEK